MSITRTRTRCRRRVRRSNAALAINTLVQTYIRNKTTKVKTAYEVQKVIGTLEKILSFGITHSCY